MMGRQDCATTAGTVPRPHARRFGAGLALHVTPVI